MKIIGFWDNSLSERGTTIALFDYAYYNQKILNNKSIIFYNKNLKENNPNVIEKFTKNFDHIYGVNDFSEVDDILLKHNANLLYVIKSGNNDGKISRVIKTVVHCVFYCGDPHGAVYASISHWVPPNNGQFPVVPHMINLPNHSRNLRNKLGIPENAIVYGRHGGYGQFDIDYVQQAVYDIALNNSNIYFLFANTKPFCAKLPNIIHLPTIIDLDEKVEFINTCDAMLWGRSDGETFGLSIGEFSSKNKPIFCCVTGYLSHLYLLKDKANIYDESTIKEMLTNFDVIESKKTDWNAYDDYTPEKVMRIFKQVFIDNVV